jgi:hypothetical protein
MSEAELAIEEKLKRKRQEEQQAWQEYLQLRAKQRAKEEEDLRKLKERQVSSTTMDDSETITHRVLAS